MLSLGIRVQWAEIHVPSSKCKRHRVKITMQQSWYRNGQLHEEMPLRNGQRHGVVRTWHKNGHRAAEERYAAGRLHGICRQWSETGRLLGKYRMVHGTGVQYAWHDNGRLQLELTTVRGEFCGRSRSWLNDGTLLSDAIYLRNKLVSAEEYRAAAGADQSLPKLGRAVVKQARPVSEKHIHQVFITALLAKPNCFEARAWLESRRADRATRTLGRFKRASAAAKFVAALYDAGAVEVLVTDVYDNKSGAAFADSLLVRLPNAPAKRKTIRKVCQPLQKRALGVVQPDADLGESHLFLSLT